jgi:hypothetical protein
MPSYVVLRTVNSINEKYRVVDPYPDLDWVRVLWLCESWFGSEIPDPDPVARKRRNKQKYRSVLRKMWYCTTETFNGIVHSKVMYVKEYLPYLSYKSLQIFHNSDNRRDWLFSTSSNYWKWFTILHLGFVPSQIPRICVIHVSSYKKADFPCFCGEGGGGGRNFLLDKRHDNGCAPALQYW